MAIRIYELCGADPALRFSPYCWMARLALAHKNLKFQTVPVPFTEIAQIAGGDFTTTVPVIDDNGRMIRDSFAIARHLDRTNPQFPLFGPDGLAFARFVEATMRATINPVILPMILTDIHAALAPDDQAYFRQSRERRLGRPLEQVHQGTAALADRLARACAPLRAVLKHGPWIGGQTPLYVDYIAAGPLIWLYVFAHDMPLSEDDPVSEWFARILDLHDGLVRNTPRAAA